MIQSDSKELIIKIFFSLLIYLSIVQSLYSDAAVVFTYHRFGETKYPSTNIRIEQFEQHLNYLEKNNFNVWPLSKIVRYINDEITIPKKTVALTMDDAYLSIYEKAYPLLKKKKFPFTVFVNTSKIRNKSNTYLNWNQMREMSLNGAELSNHSLTHDVLIPRDNEEKKQWQKRIKKELEGAQIKLQKEIGIDTNNNPKIISYPYGEYNLESAQYIESLGYVGVTQTSGPIDSNTDLRFMPRFAMAEAFGDIDGFALKANTLPLPIASASTYEPILEGSYPPSLVLNLKHPIKRMNCFTSNGQKINIKWISELEAEIKSDKKIRTPRDRYTCTAPAKDKKWYWYSHLWIIKD